MRKSVCALVCATAAALAAPALQAAPEAVSGATVKANLQGGAMPENVDAVTSASAVPETLRQKVVPNGFTCDLCKIGFNPVLPLESFFHAKDGFGPVPKDVRSSNSSCPRPTTSSSATRTGTIRPTPSRRVTSTTPP